MPVEVSKASQCEIEVGEATAWLKTRPRASLDLILLDPPYNVSFKHYGTYKDDDKPPEQYLHEQLLLLTLAKQALKDGGSLFYLNYPEMASEIWARADFLTKVKQIAWVSHAHVRSSLTGCFRKALRTWLWFAKGEPKVHPVAFRGEYRNRNDFRVKERIAKGYRPQGYDWFLEEGVRNTSRVKRAHPCQLPSGMVERFILGTTDPGDLVGDPYLGSGTTALAALKHGRAFAGCDLDPKYVEVATKAVEEAFGPLAAGNPHEK